MISAYETDEGYQMKMLQGTKLSLNNFISNIYLYYAIFPQSVIYNFEYNQGGVRALVLVGMYGLRSQRI